MKIMSLGDSWLIRWALFLFIGDSGIIVWCCFLLIVSCCNEFWLWICFVFVGSVDCFVRDLGFRRYFRDSEGFYDSRFI